MLTSPVINCRAAAAMHSSPQVGEGLRPGAACGQLAACGAGDDNQVVERSFFVVVFFVLFFIFLHATFNG